jgi:alpha-L-fucosidase
LSAACKKQGLAFGTYYSVTDWYDPNWPVTSPAGSVKRRSFDMDAYEKFLQGQITELIKNYGPLLTIWNDVPNLGADFGKRGANTIKLVRSLQPDILINDRTGDGGDYGTPEQVVGGFDLDHPWESCMTVSAHNAWAWGGAQDGVKPLAACLDMVIRGAGGDGNVLLNVGPRPDGVIDPEQVSRLKEMGAWLAQNGESIYGTRGGPFKPGKWGASTRKGNRIYVHALKFDGDQLALPAIPARITAARLLSGGPVQFQQTEAGITLTVPAAKHDAIDTLIALDIDRPAMEIAPVKVIRRSASLASGAKVTASNVFQKQESEYGPQAAFDDDPDSRWATDGGTKQAWIAADLGQPRAVRRVRVVEAPPYAGRVHKFEFQYREGEAWKTIFTGTTLGEAFTRDFPAVTAREFRLNILDATEGPTIAEIELLE